MADLTSLLRDVRGLYSDRGRDQLPAGSVWELSDWVPLLVQAGARIRGAWTYQSAPLPNIPDAMVYATFLAGPKLLVANGSVLSDIPLTGTPPTTPVATQPIVKTKQSPIMHRDKLIVPAGDGTSNARVISWNGTAWTVANTPGAPSGAYPAVGMYACVFKDRTVLANSAANPSLVVWSPPGDPLGTTTGYGGTYDAQSFNFTSFPIKGLAAQRAQILCFHDSSVERLRGTTPADSHLPPAQSAGDLILDVLWDRAGCYDARSIALWQDNVIFADARGIHLTDGSLVRNMTVQGGVINAWHQAFNRGGKPPDSVCGGVYRDYYLCSIRHETAPGSGVLAFPPDMFVIDIPTRRIFTFGNIDSVSFTFSVGTTEQFFGTNQATKQVTDLTRTFDPDNTKLQIDGNNAPVLPAISTGWNLLTKKPGFKRVIEAQITYQADRDDDSDTLQAYYSNSPIGADRPLTQLHSSKDLIRRPVAIRRRMEGLAMRLAQTQPTKDTRLFDISVRAYAEQESRT